MLNVGFGNSVALSRILCILSPASAPVRRFRDEARTRNQLIDATEGRRTRSIIITDTGHVILSGLSSDTLNGRIGEGVPVMEGAA